MAITHTPMVIMVLGVRVIGVMVDEVITVLGVRVTGVMVDGVIMVLGVRVTGVMGGKFGSYLGIFYYPKRKIRIQNQRGFWDLTLKSVVTGLLKEVCLHKEVHLLDD